MTVYIVLEINHVYSGEKFCAVASTEEAARRWCADNAFEIQTTQTTAGPIVAKLRRYFDVRPKELLS